MYQNTIFKGDLMIEQGPKYMCPGGPYPPLRKSCFDLFFCMCCSPIVLPYDRFFFFPGVLCQGSGLDPFLGRESVRANGRIFDVDVRNAAQTKDSSRLLRKIPRASDGGVVMCLSKSGRMGRFCVSCWIFLICVERVAGV